MSEKADRVAIGKLGRPHGVRGEARLFLFNPHSETVVEGLDVSLCLDKNPPIDVKIEKARYADRFVIVKFAGINSREGVDEFKHAHVEVGYDALPELGEDQFYHVDLIGAQVYIADQENGDVPPNSDPFGKVDRFFDTGANDVIVVKRPSGEELFVPIVEHAVSLLDFEREIVILQPLEIWTPPEYKSED